VRIARGFMGVHKKPLHVLIVEDDQMTALVISEYLRAFGYRVTLARNGVEGITQFISDPPALAIVDLLLPRKTGFEVCFEMKLNAKTIPVVLMSAVYRNQEAAETYARALFADGFMLKPFDLDVLVSRVHELIGDP
jgi:DNA-binding response OmpR family regulator